MRYIGYCLFAFFCTLPLHAANVSGTFDAKQVCPAYLSKNQKTNPDNLTILPQTSYQLKEINRTRDPDWFRIVIGDGQYPLRWVSAECGEAIYDSSQGGGCQQSAGLADSYVLALSLQPAFCETYGYEAGKAECRDLPVESYQASHLVLHGLWPNQNACGQHYGFCGVSSQAHHCDYPPLPLSDQVGAKLKVLMPSYAHGSCLERHEWNKHGSCQILSADDYFTLAMRLTSEADSTPFGVYLHQHVGERIPRAQLQEKINESFGAQNARKIYLGCKNGMLVEVYIQLPPLIPAAESLTALVDKAPEANRYQGCPAMVGISDFTSKE
ncbi:ribonuclease T [Legionella dresdenensis]|uniref:Ribonuclease T n=1 Tax=Legionella dresdenensis TaxID=450200 RepID=A0ABV8CHK5_9GAMM